MGQLRWCKIEQLDNRESKFWLDWILGYSDKTAVNAPVWLLAYCESGVTWGKYEAARWHLGSELFPDLCPRPTPTSLLEARIFWSEAEVLIWQARGCLRGRVLKDVTDGDLWTQPEDELRLLIAGKVLERRSSFSHVLAVTGQEQALPLIITPARSWPRLRVRNYFEVDETTGAIRVAATRLVEVL
ncbi:MAG: CRISPR-associated protein Csx19 [Acidobacteriota bacterium]|nr:CRISPR-associated protein Csx19 [Blastocatellia bacterium]MDW8411148.1 CRISPR-associated protein Csx19 [Acidobacteriota bacterium]